MEKTELKIQSTISLEEAQKIVSDLSKMTLISIGVIENYKHSRSLLLRVKEYSLFDMVCANRIVHAHQSELMKNQKSGETINVQTTQDPRLIAAIYTFFNYSSCSSDAAEPIFNTGAAGLFKVNI